MNPRILSTLCLAFLTVLLTGQTEVSHNLLAALQNSDPIAVDLVRPAILPEHQNIALDDLRSFSLYDLNSQAVSEILSSEHELISLSLQLEQADYELSLLKTDFLHHDFKVIDSKGDEIAVQMGAFYRGIVNNDVNSYAAFSIFADQVIGIFSTEKDGNVIFGQLDGEDQHILYRENDLNAKNPFVCGVQEDMIPEYSDLNEAPASLAEPCKKVNIYIEVDNIMYRDFNSSPTQVTNFVTGLFNVSAMIYENEDITIGIKTIKIWDTPDGYRKNESRALLDDFSHAIQNNIDGDIGHCLTTTSGNLGGIAWLDVLCRSYVSRNGYNRTAISDIARSYRQLPSYSWSVMVITHEMGHNLGSPHTHNCSWGPSRNQALDNCYDTEGSCSPGPTPVGGGTIMSYCHLTSHGVNLTRGFGQEPGDLIRARVQAAGCLGSAFEANIDIEGEASFFEGDTTILMARPFGPQYTFQWYKDNAELAGETTSSLIVTTAGEYFCEVMTTCSEFTESVNIEVEKFYISLHCPIQEAESGMAEYQLDTFFVNVAEVEYPFDIPQSFRDNVPTMDVASTFLSMEVCMGNYFPSRLADLSLRYTAPAGTNVVDREIRNHKTVVFGDRCYNIDVADIDPTGIWVFIASDLNDQVPNSPESYVSPKLIQKWELHPRPSDCNLFICAGDTAQLDAGIAGLEYLWSTGDTSQVIDVFEAGTYSVTVTNGPVERTDDIEVIILQNEFEIDTTICEGDIFDLGGEAITEPGSYMATLTSSKGCDSIVYLNLTTTTRPTLEEDLHLCYGDDYNGTFYFKDTILESIFNLPEGCDSLYRLYITVNPEIEITFEIDTACNDVGATVRGVATGGSPDYEYNWSNGSSGAEISGVRSGRLACLIMDEVNCTTTGQVMIANYDSVAASTSSEDVKCHGDSTGTIDLEVLEGTAPFTFAWDHGAQSEDITDLRAGTYSVLITDQNNCQERLFIEIEENDEIEANPKITGSNKGQRNGIIELSPSGGVRPYTYLWDNGSTDSIRNDLSQEIYTVTVTDALGCERSFDIEVSPRTSLTHLTSLIKYDVFPNPTNENLNVYLSLESKENVQLALIDLLGRSVRSEVYSEVTDVKTRLDLSNISSGHYILTVTIGKEIGHLPIIKGQ